MAICWVDLPGLSATDGAGLALRVILVARTQLRVPCDEFEIDRRLEIFKLSLHPSEPRANVACNLLTEVADTERAADEYTQQSAHEEDQCNHHGSRLSVGSLLPVCTLPSAFRKVAISHMSVCHFANCLVSSEALITAAGRRSTAGQ